MTDRVDDLRHAIDRLLDLLYGYGTGGVRRRRILRQVKRIDGLLAEIDTQLNTKGG